MRVRFRDILEFIMSPRRTKTSVYLDQKDLDALNAISKKTMIPMASLIREAIRTIIKQYSKKS
jgi:predicted DNA-binding protein